MRRWLVAALLLAGCTDPGADEPQGPATEASGAVTNVTWSFGQAEGQFARRWHIESTNGTSCSFLAAAMGITPDVRPTMAFFIVDADSNQTFISRGQGTIGQGSPHVHAAGTSQGLPGSAFPWAYAVSGALDVPAGGTTSLTVAVAHVAWLDEATRPLWADESLNATSAIMTLACEAPVTVTTWAGSSVVVFDETTLAGGAGAHAPGALDVSGATVASGVSLDVADPIGVLWFNIQADLLLQHVAVGVVTATTPEGEMTVIDHPGRIGTAIALGEPLQFMVESGPGTYSVEATFASVDTLGRLEGILFSLARETPSGVPKS